MIEPVFQSLILKSAGAVYILLSLILMGKTLHDFGHSFRMGLDKNNRGKLITTGIFSFSRNPFFLALNLFFLGTAMIIPGIFLIVFTLAAIVGSHLFILKEERFMLKNYGESYKSYCKKVRRYL
ncbi:MAG TPA: isoprenylcysteine carboxylmethyltransferase family protein [Draconibacterium sp.]|nr:isoprenylcysteine carboxylmethyltransferase family protein [Draconibacterium sp.]